ncbi:MAG: glycosyltransferase, partial [Bdellovibrionales bacterium]|nr:glycosyltransferase [Bdellovibrionales bacterium]
DTQSLETQLPGLKFHGKVPASVVSSAFQSAGICVVPSIWFDPFPLTSIEAQVTGCPVVTFDIGGLPEGVEDGVTGRVVREISEFSLTQALDGLLGDARLLRQMSENASREQRQYFTWSRVVEDVRGLQEEVQLSRADQPAPLSNGRLGIMTTWNQECGLATYAKFLCTQWNSDEYVVFGENVSDNRTREDESNVVRCWRWNDANWNALVSSAIEQNITILFVNAHNPELLAQSQFERAIDELHRHGIHVVILLHSIFTHRPQAERSLMMADAVIVHVPEMKLEIAAYGVSPDRVFVVPHGVHRASMLSDKEKQSVKNSLGIRSDAKMISCVGFIQPHKGIETLIEIICDLRMQGIDVQGCVAGSTNPSDPNAHQYNERLKQLARERGLDSQIIWLDRFIRDEEMSRVIRSSDLILMNYHSQHYEASGACSLAVGAKVPVLTSLAPPFHAFQGAVWHATSGFPPSLAARSILEREEVRMALQEAQSCYVDLNSWWAVARKFSQIFNLCRQDVSQDRTDERSETKEHIVSTENQSEKSENSRKMRVLVQNRANMLTQRGGDTLVVERLVAGLRSRGIDVEVDLTGQADPARFDIVHLINFALPQMIEEFGRRAKAAGTPFVVTTLCEDVPSFHNQSRAYAELLIHYVNERQSQDWYQLQKQSYLDRVVPSGAFENSWVAREAAALLVNGAGERRVVEKTYQNHAPIHIVPVGFELDGEGDEELFIREHGLKDFILCVGRLESRKNQLMLAKALEDVEIPLVFASGGFTYQPDYADSVRRFRRKGATFVLDRLSPEMLSSAYKAAKVHALPSWYELPGLVSLE